jgi:hypothetical protein
MPISQQPILQQVRGLPLAPVAAESAHSMSHPEATVNITRALSCSMA